jgi:hypothetical protein
MEMEDSQLPIWDISTLVSANTTNTTVPSQVGCTRSIGRTSAVDYKSYKRVTRELQERSAERTKPKHSPSSLIATATTTHFYLGPNTGQTPAILNLALSETTGVFSHPACSNSSITLQTRPRRLGGDFRDTTIPANVRKPRATRHLSTPTTPHSPDGSVLVLVRNGTFAPSCASGVCAFPAAVGRRQTNCRGRSTSLARSPRPASLKAPRVTQLEYVTHTSSCDG